MLIGSKEKDQPEKIIPGDTGFIEREIDLPSVKEKDLNLATQSEILVRDQKCITQPVSCMDVVLENMQHPPYDAEMKKVTIQEPTKDVVIPAAHLDSDKERVKAETTEDLVELTQTIKDVEATPLTTEQLKEIPRLMDFLHVGQTADLKKEKEPTKDVVIPAAHQDSDKERVKAETTEDLVELTQTIKDVETTPLTTEQLKEIPRLMDFLHVGQTADLKEQQEPTKDVVIPAAHLDSDKERVKADATEGLVELTQTIKGVEAPPLTTEQLKEIPRLMDFLHVGHTADLKEQQKWIENSPRELPKKKNVSSTTGGRCMFGMVINDTPRNHNWTAFNQLDDCLKNKKPFNFKPDREEVFHDANTHHSPDDISSLSKEKCPFLNARKNLMDHTPTETQDEPSSPKEECPFLRARQTAGGHTDPLTQPTDSSYPKNYPFLTGRHHAIDDILTPPDVPLSDVEFIKDNKRYRFPKYRSADVTDEKHATSEIQSTNTVKIQEVTAALDKYKRQLKEFQTLQKQVLYLQDRRSEELPQPGFIRENRVMPSTSEDRGTALQTKMTDRDKMLRSHAYSMPRKELLDRQMMWKLLGFCLMFVVAQVWSFVFR